MGKWPKIIESIEVEGKPLYKNAGETKIVYTKYDRNLKGDGYPVEGFQIYDPEPSSYPGYLSQDSRLYGAYVSILRNEDGSIYPQFTITDRADSFSVWDKKQRLGGSDLKNLTEDQLNVQQMERLQTVKSIFAESLVEMARYSPENSTFQECLEFLGAQSTTEDCVQ